MPTRYWRALLSLSIPLLAVAVGLVALGPAASVRAAQGAAAPAAPAVPEECSARLPLPSELPFAKSEYERILGRFLKAGCYLRLGWQHDKQIRPTGPTLAALGGDPHVPSWVTSTLGTHNTVVIYYSPDVYRWMCERDAADERRFVAQCEKTCPDCRLDAREPVRPIADGAMILKLMYGNTTAERLQNPAIPPGDPNMIALMVKDSRGARDGWYWGSWDPQATEASQLDWPPPANLPYPWMGFGYYCVNCHASARDEHTFSSLNNVLGDPDSFLKYYYQDQPPIAGEPPQKALETLSAHERFEPLQDLVSKLDTSGPGWSKVPWPNPAVKRVRQPSTEYAPQFLRTFGARSLAPPGPKEITTALPDRCQKSVTQPSPDHDHAHSQPTRIATSCGHDASATSRFRWGFP